MSEEQRPRLRDLFRPRPISTDRTVTTEADEAVPIGLRITAGYAWRILLIAAVVAGYIWLAIQLKMLVIPLMVGMLITALLWPVFEWMLRKGLPRWLAVAIAIIGTLVIVTVLVGLVVWQIRQQLPDVQARSTQAFEDFKNFLLEGPLHLTDTQIQGYLDQGLAILNEQAQLLWNGALAVGTTAAHVATGAVLSLFILICLLADGGGIWKWTLRLFPRVARSAADGAARNGWTTIVNYARTQLFVAA